jgi:hypothetical protein
VAAPWSTGWIGGAVDRLDRRRRGGCKALQAASASWSEALRAVAAGLIPWPAWRRRAFSPPSWAPSPPGCSSAPPPLVEAVTPPPSLSSVEIFSDGKLRYPLAGNGRVAFQTAVALPTWWILSANRR